MGIPLTGIQIQQIVVSRKRTQLFAFGYVYFLLKMNWRLFRAKCVAHISVGQMQAYELHLKLLNNTILCFLDFLNILISPGQKTLQVDVAR